MEKFGRGKYAHLKNVLVNDNKANNLVSLKRDVELALKETLEEKINVVKKNVIVSK